MPRASVGEVELEYEVMGPRVGMPLLLIGGLGGQLISWDDPFCHLLANRGYTAIRFDNRDAGLSTALDDLGVPDLLGLVLGAGVAPYLLDDMAVDVRGLLDHLGLERVHVLGLSMGGMIGQLFALRYPHRVMSLATVLSGPAGRPSRLPSPPVVEALLRPPGTTSGDRVAAAVELRRALAGTGMPFDEEEARRRAELQIARAHRPAGTMRQAAAVLATPNRLNDLRRLSVPTLVVHGELDPLVPFASAEAAARMIPGARFIPVPGLGHDLPPEVALDIVVQLDTLRSESAASA